MSLEALPSRINPAAYNFIESIGKEADRLLFPDTHHQPLIIAPEEDGIRRAGEVWSGTALRREISKLLPEMAGEIATYAHNFSELVIMLGLTNPKFKMPEHVVEIAAKDMLQRLPQALVLHAQGLSSSPKEQLLTSIFYSGLVLPEKGISSILSWDNASLAAENMRQRVEPTLELMRTGTVTPGLYARIRHAYLNAHLSLFTLHHKIYQTWAEGDSRRWTRLVSLGVFVGSALCSCLSVIYWISRLEASGRFQPPFQFHTWPKVFQFCWKLLAFTALFISLVAPCVMASASIGFYVNELLTGHLFHPHEKYIYRLSQKQKYFLWMHLMQNPQDLYAPQRTASSR